MLGAQPVLIPLALMSLLLIARHRSNITKLLAGQESRIGGGRKASGN